MMMRAMACAGFLAIMTPSNLVFAFNQPPANLGATTFLDGGGAPPGVYLIEYLQQVEGVKALDKNGNAIPGAGRVGVLAQLNQLWLLTPVKVAGAYVGVDLFLPIAAITADAPVATNRMGMGDFTGGLGLQWNEHTVLGKPFFHRLEVFANFPTGSYNSNYAANPGSNLLSVEAYHAFTWLFAEGWETSWRMGYAYNGTNDATGVRPGQMFHMNYAVSRAVSQKWRLGAAGYMLQQTTDDHVAGVPSIGSRERVFAAGPGIAYTTPDFMIMFSHPIEFGARNRYRGNRTTAQFIVHF